MRRFSGEALRKYRKAAGHTAVELAALVNVQHQSIYRYERGLGQPNANTLALLAHVLQVDINDFFDLFEGDELSGQVPYPALTPAQREALRVLLGGAP